MKGTTYNIIPLKRDYCCLDRYIFFKVELNLYDFIRYFVYL